MDDRPTPGRPTSGRWEDADAIFRRALDLPPEERQRFVDRACRADPTLGATVHRLLELAALTRDGFLESPRTLGPFGGSAPEGTPGDARQWGLPAPGDRISSFELLEPLGEGGTGVVFRARRVEPDFGQEVAVKVLFGTTLPGAADRFEQERAVLARLRHPHIVGLIEGGVTEGGYRYLVMELVQGTPITVHCRRDDLPVPRILRLFLRVCDAVSAAHGRMVVHGDLKPSNLLVTPAGHPKLLDFGIARVLETGGHDGPSGAGPGRGALSPLHASPEQVRGEGITVASDVFQLGTLLHELLSGTNPWTCGTSDPEATLRRILEGSPPRPSEVAGEPTRARAGRAGAGELRLDHRRGARLRGDLDAIVLRCLQADPAQRYSSVAELSADLQRHLDHQPVQARNGGMPYRAGRFVRRRPLAASLLGAGLALATIGVSGGVLHSARISAERERAVGEADRAEAVVDFLLGLFSEAGGSGAVDTLTAGRLLELGEARIAEEMQEYPELRLDLMGTLAEAYWRIGRTREAIDLDLRSMELARDRWDPDDRRMAALLLEVGSRRLRARHWPAAREHLEASLAVQRALPRRLSLGGEEDRDRLRETLFALAMAYRETGDAERAVEATREAMALRGPGYAEGASGLSYELGRLAFALRGLEEFAEAEWLYMEAIRLAREGGATSEGGLPMLLNNYASLLRATEREAEAEPFLREMLALEGRDGDGYGEGREIGYLNLISLLTSLGRHEEALALAHEMNAWIRSDHPPDHWRVGRSTMQVGMALLSGGDCEGAEPWMEESVRIYRTGLGPDHGWTAGARVHLGGCLLELGREEEAAPVLEGVLDPLLGESTPRIHTVELALDHLLELARRRGDDTAAREFGLLRTILEEEGVVAARAARAGGAGSPPPPLPSG